MNLIPLGIVLVASVNLIIGTPEIKSGDPQQRYRTPAFLTEQQRRYVEAVKGGPQFRPLRTEVIPQRTDRHESAGDGRLYRPALSPVTRYETRGMREHSRQYRPVASSPVIPQNTDRHENYGREYKPGLSPVTRYETRGMREHSRQYRPVASSPVIPQNTDRHENYGREYRPGLSPVTRYETRGMREHSRQYRPVASSPVIPQNTDRHKNYGRENQLLAPRAVTPQKTDRHLNLGTGRDEKYYRTYSSRTESRAESRHPDSAVEELWSTRGGSVKSEITDTRLKLPTHKYVENAKG